jgi:ATP-dependent Clp protease protease subunit
MTAHPRPGWPEEGHGTGADPFSRLYARRSVWLPTILDDAAANRVAVTLMALDADSDDPIELVINSPGGPIDAGLAVIDTLDVLRAPVATLCLGQAGGTAAAVLACGRGRRRATPTARLCLRLAPASLSGGASHLRARADQLEQRRDELAVRLASATGQLPAVIALHLEEGRFMTADQAVGYGLVDELATRRTAGLGPADPGSADGSQPWSEP